MTQQHTFTRHTSSALQVQSQHYKQSTKLGRWATRLVFPKLWFVSKSTVSLFLAMVLQHSRLYTYVVHC